MGRGYRNFDDVLEVMRERKATQDAKDRTQDEQDAYADALVAQFEQRAEEGG